MPRIAYFIPHPTQYQSPMIRHLVACGFELEVIYNSSDGATEYYDPGFARNLRWDIPLLEGYPHQVHEDAQGFWRQFQTCYTTLKALTPDVVWIHGWGYSFTRAAWLAAWILRIPTLLRGEASLPCVKGGPLRRFFHRWVFSTWFLFVDHFLAIGSANREFYSAYGVSRDRVTLVPYAVDNAFFADRCAEATNTQEQLRKRLQIAADRQVVLFAGRLIPEKSVDLLLSAWEALIQNKNLCPPPLLIIAGDGPMRDRLESQISEHLRPHIRFTGFLNQTELPAYYRLCDALVLPSGFEPWGVVVNEVMNAGKSVILSDVVGAGRDLVHEGRNGWLFASGDPASLTALIERVFSSSEAVRQAGKLSREIVGNWGLDAIATGLSDALGKVLPGGSFGFSSSTRVSTHGRNFETRGGVFLAYTGFHEIPQMALAAYEAGLMDGYYCTVYSGPGTWGSRLSRLRNIVTVDALGKEVVPHRLVVENPWPVVVRQLGKRLNKFDPGKDWDTGRWFGRAAAARMRKMHPRIVVGAESCAEILFEAAKRQGARCMLDCHGIPVPFLEATMKAAAAELGLPAPPPCETPEMSRSKERERELADIIVLCSVLQRDIHASFGVPASKLRAVPLWVDTQAWHPAGRSRSRDNSPAKILFAGTGNLAKGLPYLLLALEGLGTDVELTIVGNIAENMQRFLQLPAVPPKAVSYVPKSRLRDFYWSHDLLVMPSLGDSFGFVALEAMACGLPVIATEHCGVPLPHADWRVPARSASSIRDRVQWYLNDPQRLVTDSHVASSFASQFPPSHYRAQIQQIYRELLATPA